MKNVKTRVASMVGTVAIAAAGIGVFGPGATPSHAESTIVQFQSPTGNAHCMIYTDPDGDNFVQCELIEFTGKAPARPGDCDLDWVPGASVDNRGRVFLFGCQGDTIRDPSSRKLAYGKSIKGGAFTCTSAQTGITCKVKSGRGFLVSRAVIKKI